MSSAFKWDEGTPEVNVERTVVLAGLVNNSLATEVCNQSATTSALHLRSLRRHKVQASISYTTTLSPSATLQK